jgi:hypothetical protein
MKTIIETPAGLREIDRGELGRALHGLSRRCKVCLVPETADEVSDQRRKAKKALEERRSHAKHVHRPSRATRDAFFDNVRPSPAPEETASWWYESILDEAGISPTCLV